MERPVCFSHTTSMQILRALHRCGVFPRITNATRAPSPAPPYADLREALHRLAEYLGDEGLSLPIHLTTGSPSRPHQRRDVKVHVFSDELPRRTLLKLDEDILLAAPPFAFTQTAALNMDMIPLLQLGFELCGSYQTRLTGVKPSYDAQPLLDLATLRRFVERNPGLRGIKQVRASLPYLAEGSASPRETACALLLGLPKRYGGFGLGMPTMNHPVKTDAQARMITGKQSLRCDLCWPKARLDVEYQSRETHGNETSRISDSKRQHALESMGWTVLNITNADLESSYAMESIAATIARKLGMRQRFYLDEQVYWERQHELRHRLSLL